MPARETALRLFRCSGSFLMLASVVFTAPSVGEAEDDPDCLMSLDDAPPNAPRFESFQVVVKPIEAPAPVDLASNRSAREFRTVLKDGAAKGPNFAGHFTIVGWGCGTSCLQWAIVDATTGRVFFSKEAPVVSAVHVDVEKHASQPGLNADLIALRFRRDSSLVAVLGAPNEDEKREGIAYYRWTGKRLERLSFAPYAAICSSRADKHR